VVALRTSCRHQPHPGAIQRTFRCAAEAGSGHCRCLLARNANPTGIGGQRAALGKSTSNMRNPKLTLKKSRLWTVLRPPFRATGAKRTCRSGRSGSDANEANPSAPGRDIVPHCAGGRQMVLAGGQRDRAARCPPRGRPLDGLAAFPPILSADKGSRDGRL
jgi:hypothetical protein